MQHTYPFQPGSWRATGTFFDSSGSPHALFGETEIRHREDRWIIHGRMELGSAESAGFVNLYDVVPFEPNGDHTTWTSSHPALGRLAGTFCVVGDSLLSQWQSSSERFRGSEVSRRVDAWTYHVRGAMFERDRRTASWELHLAREGVELPPDRG